MTAQEGQTEVRRYRWPELTSGEIFTGKEDAYNHRTDYVLASDYDALKVTADLRDAAVSEACARLKAMEREVEGLRGDLNIARLQRDAKLCSECPRAALTPDGKDV